MALIDYLRRSTSSRKPAPYAAGVGRSANPTYGMPRMPSLPSPPSSGGGGPGLPVPRPMPTARVSSPNAPVASTDRYGGLIASDPLYQQTKADLAAQGIADLSGFGGAAARALVQFGEVPSFTGAEQGLFKDLQIDPATGQVAQANTASGMSTLARLMQQHLDAQRGVTNNLAGRGLIHSGETGFQLGREQTEYARAQYDARQQLLDLLAGYEGSYTAAERARQEAQRQAAAEAAARQQAILNAAGPPQLPSGQAFLPTPYPMPPYAAGPGYSGPNPTYR